MAKRTERTVFLAALLILIALTGWALSWSALPALLPGLVLGALPALAVFILARERVGGARAWGWFLVQLDVSLIGYAVGGTIAINNTIDDWGLIILGIGIGYLVPSVLGVVLVWRFLPRASG